MSCLLKRLMISIRIIPLGEFRVPPHLFSYAISIRQSQPVCYCDKQLSYVNILLRLLVSLLRVLENAPIACLSL